MSTTRSRWGIPLTIMALALSGCGQPPERAVTVGADSATEVAPTADAAVRPAGAGDELDGTDVTKALLDAGDMPTGWSQGENSPEDEGETTVEPTECQNVFDQFDSTKTTKPAAEGMVTFNEGGDFGVELVQEISSFEKNGQGGKVQEVADALGKCSNVTIIDGSDRIPVKISSFSFPNLGEQTLAMRLAAESDGIQVIIDAVFVAVGHNLVSYTASGLKPVSGTELEAIARTGMEKVAEVTKQ